MATTIADLRKYRTVQLEIANKELYEERWPKLRLANGRLFEAQQFGERGGSLFNATPRGVPHRQ
jgi:hypothetical protein